jgi:hypothetical protein
LIDYLQFQSEENHLTSAELMKLDEFMAHHIQVLNCIDELFGEGFLNFLLTLVLVLKTLANKILRVKFIL